MQETEKPTILLVDDERLVRFTITAWLKTVGYEVVSADNPEEALRRLETGRYDAVVSDVVMGAVDGFAFRDIIRRNHEKLPVIFLTSLVNDSNNTLMQRIFSDIYSCYVPKNAKREYLLTRLQQMVRIYRAENAVRDYEKSTAESLQLSSRVQRALLPPSYFSNGEYQYSSFQHPFNVVSGDLFEFFQVTPKQAVFVFGDIAGHGVHAAFSMTAVQAYLKGLHGEMTPELAREPHRIIAGIDAFLRAHLPNVTYMAASALYIDFGEKRGRYARAGIDDPIVVSRTDGRITELNPGNRGYLPLGLCAKQDFDEAEVVEFPLPDDSVVFVRSDGFDDVSSDEAGDQCIPPEVFKDIVSEVVKCADDECSIEAIPFHFADVLEELGYSHVQDDMTCGVIGATPKRDDVFIRRIPMDSLEKIDDAVIEAGQWVASRKLPDIVQVKLELLLSEHLVNIERHGLDDYGRTHEQVLLRLSVADGRLDVMTWDRGTSAAADYTDVAPHPDIELERRNDAMDTHGRGLPILRKVSTDIGVETFSGLNRTTFHIHIPGEEELNESIG